MSEKLKTSVILRYPDSCRIICVEFGLVSMIKIPFNGPQRQKSLHVHKEQGPFYLFIHLPSRVCLLLVDSKNTILTPVSPFTYKMKKTKKLASLCISNMTDKGVLHYRS